MKVIKAKIKIDRSTGATVYNYPPEWEPPKIPFIVYPTERGSIDEIDEGGQLYQYVIATVPDDLYDKMIQNTDVFQPIFLTEAEVFGNRHRPQVNKINDTNLVMSILAKSVRGEILTLEERNAIDPNNPEGAISKSRSCKDVWDEYKVIW